jgi:nicotinamidase-related amidase
MKKILVVIDMQNDFIDVALGTPEAVAIVENVKAKILSYPRENVFATRDTHHQYYMDTQEGRNLPVPHCIRGTDGWQIRPEIAELIFPDHIIDKPTFGSTQLAKLMEVLERREEDGIEIELVGLCTDICVVSNALLLKASMPETPISCDASCCAGVTPAKHEAALETMRSCQIRIIND